MTGGIVTSLASEVSESHQKADLGGLPSRRLSLTRDSAGVWRWSTFEPENSADCGWDVNALGAGLRQLNLGKPSRPCSHILAGTRNLGLARPSGEAETKQQSNWKNFAPNCANEINKSITSRLVCRSSTIS